MLLSEDLDCLRALPDKIIWRVIGTIISSYNSSRLLSKNLYFSYSPIFVCQSYIGSLRSTFDLSFDLFLVCTSGTILSLRKEPVVIVIRFTLNAVSLYLSHTLLAVKIELVVSYSSKKNIKVFV